MRLARAALFAVLLATPALRQTPAVAAASCESLASLALPNAKITLAQAVPAGDFSLKAGGPVAEDAKFTNLPAFCRIAATLTPSSDSDINVEVWLPASGWNGKYQAVGNGGWAGSISYPAMAEALKRGYAASSTDTGHIGSNGRFALGHPEKLIDYGYRSEHEMTVHSKTIINAFYGNSPKLSYWTGCSSGGKQALMEAQRYPNDYDGIVAGDPTNNWTGRAVGSIWVAQAMHTDEASYIPPTKYAMVHDAVLAACDALDGVKDRVLDDPRVCKFDPKELECKGDDGPGCLTPKQVEAARKIYTAPTNPRTKEVIVAPLERGSELGWMNFGGPKPFGSGEDHFKYVVFQNPNWDFKTLNFDADVIKTRAIDKGTIDAMNPDLKAFQAHGGKMLQYHGWADQQMPPGNSVAYYGSVLEAMGGLAKVKDFYRLYMVPGMGHCRGGDGTDTFDMLTALEQWVENGKAPDQIAASRTRNGKVDRTRPLCPYPQIAKYKGSGSIDDAANFACAMP